MPLAPAVPLEWRTARGRVRLDRPVVVGILNVTPDSFFDGGRHADVNAAVEHAHSMVEDGADIIDIGGESTRPGARVVAAEAEARRVVPVVRALHERWPQLPLTIDTTKPLVARESLAAGAAAINEVSGLRLDAALADVAAEAAAGMILMHSRGGIEDMASYALAQYADAVAEVGAELQDAVERARMHGVGDDAIVIDPGLGFAKRTAHSLALLAHIDRIAALGFPVLAGPSRKRFVGEASGGLPAELRLEGTLAACVIALLGGASLFRVHDVGPARRALDLAAAVMTARAPQEPTS
jgi:dihydropteroate synthase